MKIVSFSMAMLPLLLLAKPSLAAPPVNDLISGATEGSTLPFSAVLDTTEATTDADDTQLNESCEAPATDASVWYYYIAPSDTPVIVDVSGSDYSAGVLVGEGTPGDLWTVACGPDTVVFFPTAGTKYYVLAIDDQYDGGGNGGTLHMSFTEAEVPVLETFTVNSFGRVDTRTGVARISGTYACTTSDANFFNVDVYARQVVGRTKTIQGWGGFSATNTCDSSPRTWSVDIIPEQGKFAGGKSLTLTTAFGCGDFFCFDGFAQQTVQLRGGLKGSLRH